MHICQKNFHLSDKDQKDDLIKSIIIFLSFIQNFSVFLILSGTLIKIVKNLDIMKIIQKKIYGKKVKVKLFIENYEI